MPSQSMAGTITPVGEITEILIEGDNPGGTITPFGSLSIQVDFNLGEDVLNGVITPVGVISSIEVKANCFDTDYSCVEIPDTDYDCIADCEDRSIVLPPAITLSGVIIPVGSLSTMSNCSPATLGVVSQQVGSNSFTGFKWFKQSGSFPAEFQSNRIVNSTGFGPTHSVGVPTGHVGDAGPLLPADYQASVVVHTHAAAGTGSAPPIGAGIIARIPLNAAFNNISGYYWVYCASPSQFRLLGFGDGSDPFSSVPFFSVVTPATAYEDQDVIMTLKVQGTTLTGYVRLAGQPPSADVQMCQTSDGAYSSGGRIGIITPWTNGAGAYIKGPVTVYTNDPVPVGVLSDKLQAANGTILENHLSDTIDDFTITWSDIGSVEELDLTAIAGVLARDVYRQRTISGLTPGTTARVRASMTLDYGSVGSGVLFGVKIVGGDAQYFPDAFGVLVGRTDDVDLTVVVGLSGQIVIQYGAFGDGTALPSGQAWIFQVTDLEVFDDCS